MNIPSVLFGATIGILAGILIAVAIDVFRHRSDLKLAGFSPAPFSPDAKSKPGTIFAMSVGETGYTVPWAFYRLSNSSGYNLFLVRGDYGVRAEISGTSNVLIKRTELGIETEIKWIDICLDPDNFANTRMDWDWLQVFQAPEEPDLADEDAVVVEDASVAEEATVLEDNS